MWFPEDAKNIDEALRPMPPTLIVDTVSPKDLVKTVFCLNHKGLAHGASRKRKYKYEKNIRKLKCSSAKS